MKPLGSGLCRNCINDPGESEDKRDHHGERSKMGNKETDAFVVIPLDPWHIAERNLLESVGGDGTRGHEDR